MLIGEEKRFESRLDEDNILSSDKNLNNLETKRPDYELFTEKYSENQGEMRNFSISNSIKEIPKPNMLRKAFEMLDIHNKWEDVGLFIDSTLSCIAQANSNKILLKNINVLNHSDVLYHEAIHVAQMNQNDSKKPVLDREDAETEANSITRKLYAGKKASVSRTRCHELQYTPDEQSLLDNSEEIKKYLVPSDEQDDPVKVERKMKELKDWYKQKFNKNGMANNPLCRYANWMHLLHI